MSKNITVRDLYNALGKKLGLEWISGHAGSELELRGQFPGADSQGLAGPVNCIHPNRIQTIGRAELIYFSGLEEEFYQDTLDKLFAAKPAAVILADGIEVGKKFISRAEKEQVPLLRSSLSDSRLISDLLYYLTNVTAERTTEHGVFIDVLGVGVLLTGKAAIGKSELALELVSRGHQLIADDAPEFSRIAPDILDGKCPSILSDFLEVRGLGIINIRSMFGDSAVKQHKFLHLIIHLKQMTTEELSKMDRLRGSHASRYILGLEIPEVTLPIAPGREMAILVETAARQHILKLKGYNAADAFIARQQAAIEKKTG
ncbi:MAG: HPr(Ser) kinase/phosphatase [Candidatus Sedimenticola sp. (ex Thyasira tokunagai)]